MINFSINSCPKPVFEEFKKLASDEFADTYHLLLRYLIDSHKRMEHDQVLAKALWSTITLLESRLDEMNDRIAKLEGTETLESVRKVYKTFGKGVDKNE